MTRNSAKEGSKLPVSICKSYGVTKNAGAVFDVIDPAEANCVLLELAQAINDDAALTHVDYIVLELAQAHPRCLAQAIDDNAAHTLKKVLLSAFLPVVSLPPGGGVSVCGRITPLKRGGDLPVNYCMEGE